MSERDDLWRLIEGYATSVEEATRAEWSDGLASSEYIADRRAERASARSALLAALGRDEEEQRGEPEMEADEAIFNAPFLLLRPDTRTPFLDALMKPKSGRQMYWGKITPDDDGATR